MLQRWIYLAISKIGLDKWVWTKNFINGLFGIRKNFRGDFTILLEDMNFLIRVRVFSFFFFFKKKKKKKKRRRRVRVKLVNRNILFIFFQIRFKKYILKDL